MAIDCIVRNGKLVIPGYGILEADIAIDGEKIAQIGRGIPDRGEIIDAKGNYVFPGCVDIHTHYGHFNEFYNEMETESRCLASLGVTTSVVLLDRCIKNMEDWKERTKDPDLFEQPVEKIPGSFHAMWKASYKKIFPAAIEKSEKVSANDFAFHLAMINTNQISEIPYYVKEFGIQSFKCWPGQHPSVALSSAEMWMFFKKCKEVGVLPYVNTLNHNLRQQVAREVEECARRNKSLVGPFLVKKAQGAPIIETFHLHTTLCLAKEIGVRELVIAHVVSRDSVKLIRHYRNEFRVNVQGESCSVWLSLWWPEVGEKLGYRATCLAPQIGDKEDVDMLWDGIRNGDISCVGTDGVISPQERYPDGKPNPFYKPPPTKEHQGLGFPSHICHFPVVLHEGMKRDFSPVEIAEICALNPAKLMRLHPKKGSIAVGSDADLVIMEIGKPHIVKKEELNTAAPFNPWEGCELSCWPLLTMLRGQVIFENGKQIKEKAGKYLPRYPE